MPKKIVRIRYVDDIVHRPAPVVRCAGAVVATTYSAPVGARRARSSRSRSSRPATPGHGRTPTSGASATSHEGSEPDSEQAITHRPAIYTPGRDRSDEVSRQ